VGEKERGRELKIQQKLYDKTKRPRISKYNIRITAKFR
jgi:hypothetical protein